LRSMVNICEPLINVVIGNKPKVLDCSRAVEPSNEGSQAWTKKVRGQV
jgi:hypothetical protein